MGEEQRLRERLYQDLEKIIDYAKARDSIIIRRVAPINTKNFLEIYLDLERAKKIYKQIRDIEDKRDSNPDYSVLNERYREFIINRRRVRDEYLAYCKDLGLSKQKAETSA